MNRSEGAKIVWPPQKNSLDPLLAGMKTNGSRDETAQLLKAKIWRDEKFVYSPDKNDWIKTEISSENKKMTMKISQYQDIIVLDSKGLVSENLGKVLGQFYFEPEIHCYKQCGSDGTYMFHIKGHGWFIGPDPGKPDGWLKNSSDSNNAELQRRFFEDFGGGPLLILDP